MEFGIYVHTQGPSLFREVARELDQKVKGALEQTTLVEVDGLYLSFYSTSAFPKGVKRLKRRVRRNYTMKLITGGTASYKCLVEFDAEVADAELIDSSSTKRDLFEFVRSAVMHCLPIALAEFKGDDLKLVQSAVG